MIDAMIAFAKAYPFITLALIALGPLALVLLIEIMTGCVIVIPSSSSSGSGWWPHSHDDGPSCSCEDDD